MNIATAALENFEKIKASNIPTVEPFSRGHRACQGCAEVLALRLACKAVGSSLIAVSATGCMEIISSPYPQTAWEVPWIHVAFENAAAVASGVEAGRKALIRKGRHKRRRRQGGGLCRRRRHGRYRPAGPVRRPGARARLHLHLPGQRSVHEHRRAALQRHALTAP